MRICGTELRRLDALHSFDLLDTDREPSFDRLVADAADLCAAPRAALNVVDACRVWAKATFGFGEREVERGGIPCELVVAGGEELVITDTLTDPRFRDSPLVVGPAQLRAYAGVPLVSAEGIAVGALCVMDTRPRAFTPEQLRILRILAGHAVTILELRRHQARTEPRESGPASPAEVGAGLERDEFRLAFQPVTEFRTGRASAAEALVRWDHPERGTLAPTAFLPQMEATSLMIPLGRRLLELAAEAALGFRAAVPNFRVAVNVSGHQLRRPGLAEDVLDVLDRTGLPAPALTLELVESGTLDDRVARRELTTLREAGVLLAMDDFGVAYSSVMRLLDFPFTAVKIDRQLVARAVSDPRAHDTVDVITGIGRRWGLLVIAEGIETHAEDRIARDAGCTHGQGWLYGRPVAAATLTAELRAEAAAGDAPTAAVA